MCAGGLAEIERGALMWDTDVKGKREDRVRFREERAATGAGARGA